MTVKLKKKMCQDGRTQDLVIGSSDLNPEQAYEF